MNVYMKIIYIGSMSLYMYGMEQYPFVPLDKASSTYDPIGIAQSIENTKKQLHTVLQKSCCIPHNKLHNLENTLVTLREQQNKWHNEETKNKKSINLLWDKNNSQQNVSHVNIVSLYDINQYDNVTNINVSENQLQELPLYLIARACPNLETLDVSKNNISFISYQDDAPPYGIGTLPSLKKMVLSNNKLTQHDFGACFAMSPALQEIDLSDNNTLNHYTWDKISGWQHEQWPIINVCNTSLSDEMIMQLKQQYKNMIIKYFKNNKALQYKNEVININGGIGVFVLVGGLLGTGLATLISQNPWYMFGFAGSAVGGLGYTFIACSFTDECAYIYAGSETHEQRMIAGTKAEKNIIYTNADDSIV